MTVMVKTTSEQLTHWRTLLAQSGNGTPEAGMVAREVAEKLMDAVERLQAELARSRQDMAEALEARLAAVLDCGAAGCSICNDVDAKRLVDHAHELARDA